MGQDEFKIRMNYVVNKDIMESFRKSVFIYHGCYVRYINHKRVGLVAQEIEMALQDRKAILQRGKQNFGGK